MNPDASQPQVEAQSPTEIRCAVSGQLRPKAEMVEVDGWFVLPEFKDQCVELIRQGGTLNRLGPQATTKRPRAVFWTGILFSIMGPFQILLVYRGLGRTNPYGTIGPWSFVVPISVTIAAGLIWTHGRRKLTYYFVSGLVLFQIIQSLLMLMSNGGFQVADPTVGGLIWGLMVWFLIAGRFVFGMPSLAYHGMRDNRPSED